MSSDDRVLLAALLVALQIGAMAGYHKGVRSEAGLEAIERVGVMVEGFPEVERAVDKFGHTSFRVRDKPFVILGEGPEGASISVKAEPYTQAHLIEHRGFVRTPYIGQHGWASLDGLPPDDWDEIEQLVIDAYLLVAPKSLAARVSGRR